MNTELIENALISARQLISHEMESIINEDLREEFEQTLEEINRAIYELREE